MEQSNEILLDQSFPDDGDLMDHYTDKVLDRIMESTDLMIYPQKNYKYYDNMVKKLIKSESEAVKEFMKDSGELVHINLYFDCSTLIKHLARLVQLERELNKNRDLINEKAWIAYEALEVIIEKTSDPT